MWSAKRGDPTLSKDRGLILSETYMDADVSGVTIKKARIAEAFRRLPQGKGSRQRAAEYFVERVL
jgi:hypothetical protein